MTDIETLLSKMTPEQKVAFAIRCAMQVYHDPQWTPWANAWLSGEDRSKERSAAAAAARAAAKWAARAVAEEAWAAAAAEWAARAAAGEAWAAAAAKGIPSIDLPAIARQAVEVE